MSDNACLNKIHGDMVGKEDLEESLAWDTSQKGGLPIRDGENVESDGGTFEA